MAKVIIGGLLAIPIAYALVLHGFKQDPLGVGPKISTFAPFLVPNQFRGIASSDENDLPGTNAEADEDEETDEDDALAVPKLDPNRVLGPDPEEAN